jgi:hypothetical protein
MLLEECQDSFRSGNGDEHSNKIIAQYPGHHDEAAEMTMMMLDSGGPYILSRFDDPQWWNMNIVHYLFVVTFKNGTLLGAYEPILEAISYDTIQVELKVYLEVIGVKNKVCS